MSSEITLVWRLFLADLEVNRKRILLTIIAIGWGTLSIVLLLSFGEGLKRAFHKGKRGIGEGIGIVWPGNTTRAYAGLPSGRPILLTDEDAELLLARVPEIAALSREYSTRRGVTAGPKTVNCRIRGVDPSFGEMRNVIPQPVGRFLSATDLDDKRRTVGRGDELAQDLFGRQDVVGQSVQINQSTFLVVGVMQKKTMMGMYSGPDTNQASIPATTYKSLFGDKKVGNMVYKPASIEVADQAKAQIYRVLSSKYRFDPEDTRALGI